MTQSRFEEWLHEHKISEVECLVADMNGTARGKILPPKKFLSGNRSRGLRIPEDFALIGYDNWPMCAIPQISLTSVDQDPHRLGMRAAELLIERIEGRTEPVHFVTEPRLIVRQSSLSPAAS